MADFQVITRERHGLQYWLKHSTYTFAASDALCPLVAQELPKAMLSMPIGFMAEGHCYIPVAVQGLAPGQNLLVGLDGRWLVPYIPAPYRGYPFRMASTEQGEQVLCIDEASGLLSESAGEPFFDEDGTPHQSVVEILNFFTQIEANRQLTRNICLLLQQYDLIQPWPITVQGEQGEQQVEGLFRVDEMALNALSAEALAEVRNAGGLTVAYCQLLSMQHLSTLGTLAQAHAEAKKDQLAHEALAKNGELHLGFMNDGGTFSFSQ
uniref:SapC family protein n=1 Tax=Pseudomonas sp. TaxID=306 RepID=UPI00116439CA|nr:SapC family protein [Pseudomonas sp.]QDK64879.1 SapC family protein [Pseudomonas sp.]